MASDPAPSSDGPSAGTVEPPLVHLGNVLGELSEVDSFKLKQELIVGITSRYLGSKLE